MRPTEAPPVDPHATIPPVERERGGPEIGVVEQKLPDGIRTDRAPVQGLRHGPARSAGPTSGADAPGLREPIDRVLPEEHRDLYEVAPAVLPIVRLEAAAQVIEAAGELPALERPRVFERAGLPLQELQVVPRGVGRVLPRPESPVPRDTLAAPEDLGTREARHEPCGLPSMVPRTGDVRVRWRADRKRACGLSQVV